jgi:hypothetical protein
MKSKCLALLLLILATPAFANYTQPTITSAPKPDVSVLHGVTVVLPERARLEKQMYKSRVRELRRRWKL